MLESWVEMRVDILASLSEAVANFLIELGSAGVIQEGAPGIGRRKRERIIGYLSHGRDLEKKKKNLTLFLRSLRRQFDSSLRVFSRKIKDEKWAEAWKANFKTLRISPTLIVKPPWETYSPARGETVIVLNPGMAFGTGNHPSTRMCLEALEDIIPSFPHRPSLLDVGTGSGILSIAAHQMGARPTCAVDTDPLALQNAKKNARANGIRRGIQFRLGSATAFPKAFDIVVANLLPQELLPIAAALPKRVSARGILIVAGLLSSQSGEVRRAFSGQGMKVRGRKESKEWACLILGRAGKKEMTP